MADPDAGNLQIGVAKTATVSVAEAEEEAARAEKLAEEVRARALQLRRQAETFAADSETNSGNDDDAHESPSASPRWWRRKPRLSRKKTLAVGAAAVLICTSLATSGYLVAQHHTTMHRKQLAAEFEAAGRRAVMTLMTIDANDAATSFQHIIDDSTGVLKSKVSATARMLADKITESKVSSKVTVQAVAVESMSDNSGVVLVAADSVSTGPEHPPGSWRLSITLDRDDGQLKMSKVDFV